MKQVAGHTAEYAGDEAIQDQERGSATSTSRPTRSRRQSAQEYSDALAERGVELAEMVPYTLDPATLQETAANAITRLKDAGVTTMIFAGDPIAPRDFTKEATKSTACSTWSSGQATACTRLLCGDSR